LHNGAREAVEDEAGERESDIVRGERGARRKRKGRERGEVGNLRSDRILDLPALALLVVLELFPDHANHDLVADEAAMVHDLLGLLAKSGLLGDLRPEHVAGGLGEGCDG